MYIQFVCTVCSLTLRLYLDYSPLVAIQTCLDDMKKWFLVPTILIRNIIIKAWFLRNSADCFFSRTYNFEASPADLRMSCPRKSCPRKSLHAEEFSQTLATGESLRHPRRSKRPLGPWMWWGICLIFLGPLSRHRAFRQRRARGIAALAPTGGSSGWTLFEQASCY